MGQHANGAELPSSGPLTTFANPSGANGLAFGIDHRAPYGDLQLAVTAQVPRSVSLYGQGSWGASLVANGAFTRVGTLPNPASDADEARQLSGFLSDASAHAMDVLV